MKIILLNDIRHRGRRGDEVKVRPGYARNYLIPQGLALPATAGNRAWFEQQRKKIDARAAKERDEAAAIAAELAGLRLRFQKRAGGTETLYGSVTTAEIAEALAAKGVNVDRRRIDAGPGIKTIGDHVVTIDLHHDVTAELTITVEPIE